MQGKKFILGNSKSHIHQAPTPVDEAVCMEDLVMAVEAMVRGRHNRTADTSVVNDKQRADAIDCSLTLREKRIVTLMALGKTSQQISEMLNISPLTVERHRKIIKQNLGLSDVTELILYEINRGYATAAHLR